MLEEGLGVSPSPELALLEARIAARDVPGVDEGRRCYPRPRHPLRLPYSLGRAHFVGRDGEYALLAERLREAMGGSGGAVAVEGEAGIGKTRLVEEFLGYAKSRGALVLAGRCYERELGPALEPISDALGPLPDTGCRWGHAQVAQRQPVRVRVPREVEEGVIAKYAVQLGAASLKHGAEHGEGHEDLVAPVQLTRQGMALRPRFGSSSS
jgi:hypothetical protein